VLSASRVPSCWWRSSWKLQLSWVFRLGDDDGDEGYIGQVQEWYPQ
jgi:hypothetical protein